MQFIKGFTSIWLKYRSFGDTKVQEFRLVELNKKGKSVNDIKKSVQATYLFMIHKSILKKYEDLMKKLDFIPSVHHEFYKSLKSYVCKNDKNCNCNSLYLVICVFLMITVTIQCLFSYTDPNINKAFRDLAFWGKGTPLKLWVKRV